VIAPSFADIFRNNALKSGLLPVILPEEQVRQLLDVATEEPGVVGIVDLEEQSVKVGDLSFHFEMDPFERRCLLDGLDDIGLSLIHEPAISAFEARRPAWMPDLSRGVEAGR
jgi:3-isopropylmalate/(R)-2-methylmalate dehydratase small subunit